MYKDDLFELTRRVAEITGEATPIIVGSQAIYAITQFPPDIVRLSKECDYLIVGQSADARLQVNEELGVRSDFEQKYGYYADGLGLATVVLPTGWQERLQPLSDESGQVVASCIEIHDVAFSKFVAGRDKDLVFLRDAFWSEYLDTETFVARVRLLREMPQAGALRPRLERLVKFLTPHSELRHITNALQRLAREVSATDADS